ncbi:TonB family protein [Nitrospinae bacterium AH_259_B05_G02_I21]|nr:TonB family protein [Nitrospinae bacterium AH_259_B05_G02_I21]
MDLLSPAPDRAFRRSLLWLAATSAVVHGLVLSGIVTYSMMNRPPLFKGPVYTVNLVEVAGGTKAAAAGLAPPVRKRVAAVSRKDMKAPAERSLKLPSKAKLKQPPLLKKRALDAAPAPKERPVPKKTLMAKSSAGGTALSVDAASFPFTYYLRAVERKVSANWDPVAHGVPAGETRTVILAFRILRDGTVEQPVIERSSGLSYLDQSALRAVIHSAPLPPLPETFPDDSLGIHFGFHFQPEG